MIVKVILLLHKMLLVLFDEFLFDLLHFTLDELFLFFFRFLKRFKLSSEPADHTLLPFFHSSFHVEIALQLFLDFFGGIQCDIGSLVRLNGNSGIQGVIGREILL